MKKKRQRISFVAFCCYMLSTALYLGAFFRLLPAAVPDYTEILLGGLCIGCYGLFLFGLVQPQRRRKLLALALALVGFIRWFYYYILAKDILYSLMSFPADLYAEAVLIALLLSTKRGPVLRSVTVCALSIRLMEFVLELFVDGMALDPELLQLFGGTDGVVVGVLLPKLLQFAALFMLPAVLRLPDREEVEEKRILDESFFSRLDQENAEDLCLACGRELSHSGPCEVCGTEQRLERELLVGFLWPESLKAVCEKLKVGDWDGAAEEFEESLEWIEEKTFSYLGLMLANLQYAELEDLWERPVRLEMQPFWQLATNYAQGEIKTKLIRMRRMMFNLYERKRREKDYTRAEELRSAEDVETILESAKAFYCLGNFEDAPMQALKCLDIAGERLFQRAQGLEQAGEYEEAVRIYERLPRHKEAAGRATICRETLCKRSSVLHFCGMGGKIALLLAGITFAVMAYLCL